MKRQKGITLIALVVTIVVLLILAGITINYLIGDNSIFKLAQRAKDEFENSVKEEQKWLESLMGESQKKIAIRIIEEDEDGHILVNVKLNVYTDKECQNLLKEISIDENSSTNLNYSYESDDILQNGIYYIKMVEAPAGYNLNETIFEFQIKDGKNVLTICVSKAAVLPGSAFGVYATGDDILMSEMMNIQVILPEDIRNNISGQVLIEPVAEYDQTQGRYVYLDKFTKDNLKPITTFKFQNATEQNEHFKLSQQIAKLMENREYSIKAQMTNGIANVNGVSAKYAYLITLKDLQKDGYEYDSVSWVLRPGYDNDEGLKKNFIISFPVTQNVKRESLKIVTNVEENYEITNETTAFVYYVEAVLDGEMAFSNMITANVKNNGNTETIVEGIPLNSEVTVRLEYSPPGYSLTSAKEEQITMNSGTPNINFVYTATTSLRKAGIAVQEIFEFEDGWQAEKEEFKNDQINLGIEISNRTIHASVSNAEASPPYFIRMKALAPSDIELEIRGDAQGMWAIEGDGYCYYNKVLQGGKSTEMIGYKINHINDKEVKIPVIVEYVPAQYDEEGKPFANWEE